MAIEGFVGRKVEAKAVKDLIERPLGKKGSLAIQSIEGPGGVGKSSVLWMALNEVDLHELGYLTIKIAGSSREIKEGNGRASLAGIDQIIGSLVASADGGKIASKPPGYYFPKTHDAIAAINQLRVDINEELLKKNINSDNNEHIKRILKGSSGVIATLGKIFPKINEFVSTEGIDDLADEAEGAAIHLEALQEGTVYFWEKLGVGSSSATREAAKKDPDGLLASALCADLKAILLGNHEGSVLTPGHGKIKGLEKLLFIVEDYEALRSALDNFLVSNFLRLLKASGIHATGVILGRFKLSATNPIWKDYAQETRKRIVVKPFSELEVRQMLVSMDVNDEREQERAWHETRGFPFHLYLWVEELDDGGRSSTSLMEMYQRITMWMSVKEIEWLHTMIFMDEIRVDSLEISLEKSEEATAAYTWFENEGSVLEMGSNPPEMIKFVRSRLQDYLRNRNLREFLREEKRVLSAYLQQDPSRIGQPSDS